MACCIALTLFVSMVRAVWFGVTGRRPAEVGFAPPARRPAPNATRTVEVPQVQSPQPQPSQSQGQQLIVVGLTWFAIGVIGMHAFGRFDWAHASAVVDVVFHSSGIWIATWGAALLFFERRPRPIEVTA